MQLFPYCPVIIAVIFFQLSKVRCFNDFLQALKSKVEDKALVDFWEIVVQGMMAFHFLKYFYFYYSLCRRKLYVSNGTLKLNLEQHFDLGHSRSLCKRKKKLNNHNSNIHFFHITASFFCPNCFLPVRFHNVLPSRVEIVNELCKKRDKLNVTR